MEKSKKKIKLMLMNLEILCSKILVFVVGLDETVSELEKISDSVK